MTYQDAMEYRRMQEELPVLRDQLSTLDSLYYNIDGAGKRIKRLSNEEWSAINRQITSHTAKCEQFERWLATVPDRLIQTYMYMRFVDGLTWAQIGRKMHCKGPTARKAVQRYFDKEARKNV